jgi:hypothetical protein
MRRESILSQLIQRALKIVSEQEPSNWDVQQMELDEEIKRIEARSNTQKPPIYDELEALRVQKTSLETSLDQTATELRRAKENLVEETRRHRQLEGRLEGLEKRVLTVLKKK